MCALKPHHPCLHRCRKPLTETLICLHNWWSRNKNAQILVSFTSTATASGSNVRALKPHHHCTVAENLHPTLWLLTQLWSGSRMLRYRFLSRQRRPASGSNMCALKPHHGCTFAEKLSPETPICSHNCGQ